MLFFTGFGIGLLGSLHCLGMCGPLAAAMPFSRRQPLKVASQNLVYQFGRIFTYTLLGILIGFVGRGFSLAGLQQPLSIVAGALMILFVFTGLKGKMLNVPGLNRAFGRLKTKLSIFIRKKGYTAYFTTGVLNGLLPCGLVYVALFASLAAPGIEGSAWVMFGFGLGTFPLMYIAGWAPSLIPAKARIKLQRAIPVFVFLVGMLFVLRGMGLEIKYLSPGKNLLTVEKTETCY